MVRCGCARGQSPTFKALALARLCRRRLQAKAGDSDDDVEVVVEQAPAMRSNINASEQGVLVKDILAAQSDLKVCAHVCACVECVCVCVCVSVCV